MASGGLIPQTLYISLIPVGVWEWDVHSSFVLSHRQPATNLTLYVILTVMSLPTHYMYLFSSFHVHEL